MQVIWHNYGQVVSFLRTLSRATAASRDSGGLSSGQAISDGILVGTLQIVMQKIPLPKTTQL